MAVVFDKICLEILKCYRDDPEITPKDIAERCGVHRNTIYKHLKRPPLSEAIREIKGSVDQIVADAQRLAAKRLKRLIMSDNENVAFKSTELALRPRLSDGGNQTQHPISFVTVVNEVGVLETSPSSSHEVVDVIPQVMAPKKRANTKPSD